MAVGWAAMTKPVDWCIKKLEEAAADYNIGAVHDYLEMLKMWRGREQ